MLYAWLLKPGDKLYALLWIYWHVKLLFAQRECRTGEGLVSLNIVIGLWECGSTGFIEHYHWTTGAWELHTVKPFVSARVF